VAEPINQTLTIQKSVLVKNDEQARKNRQRFQALGLVTINLLSSPGSGKTALLERTLSDLGTHLPAAVIVGDLATDNDARRIRRPGVEVVQITTGNVCHLESAMIDRACADLNLTGIKLLFIENVGNLVCPASYDLGEELRVVLWAVTEGEDKPCKYPKMFKTADLVLVTKIDLAEAAEFERSTALANLGAIAPQAIVFELSARTGVGMQAWYDYLRSRIRL
jgi:hydrogenase nickel incorporation protein HypB